MIGKNGRLRVWSLAPCSEFSESDDDFNLAVQKGIPLRKKKGRKVAGKG